MGCAVAQSMDSRFNGGGEEASAERVFLSTEAWAPAWIQCAKESEAPDFFLPLHNASSGAAPEALHFGAILIIAR